MANILSINISSTGLVTGYDNLNLNQNSSDNKLYLNTVGNYDWVEYYFTRPDGYVTPKSHMIKGNYNNETGLYEFYIDIDKRITSFTLFRDIEYLLVSFICYKVVNDIPVATAITNSKIAVNRVDNSEVTDQTYNGNDVQSIFIKLGELTNKLSMLDPESTGPVLDEILEKLSSVMSDVEQIKSNAEKNPYYTKAEIDAKISSVYKPQGSVNTYADLPTSEMSNSTIGYVYNVRDSGINYAWMPNGWDSLGGDIDLTNYYNKTEIDNTTNVLSNRIATNKNKLTSVEAELSSYKDNNDLKVSNIKNNLESNYYTKDEVYNRNEIDGKLSSALKYKGTVGTYSDLLSISNPSLGDMYNVSDTGINYAWNGAEWDALSPVIDVSDYYTKGEVNNRLDNLANKNEVYTRNQIDSKISNINVTTDNLTTRINNVSNNVNTLGNRVTSEVSNLNTAIEASNDDAKEYARGLVNESAGSVVYLKDWRD